MKAVIFKSCREYVKNGVIYKMSVFIAVLWRSQLFSELDLENFKIYLDHLRDEISSNPRSFRCLTYTFAVTASKHTHKYNGEFHFWEI